jgi:tRNA pseudouridine55 synthase
VEGIVNVYKHSGPTSHDIINKIRKIFGIKRVGHCGTLDPLAEGVLVVCLGKATRLVEYLMGEDKIYETTMMIGKATDSQDITGNITSEKNIVDLDIEALKNAVSVFVGDIMQKPPMVSAIKVNGKALYKMAREGIEIERKSRLITIHSIEILDIRKDEDVFLVDMRVKCSPGTYIRTLCFDIGEKLGLPSLMSRLIRVESGDFNVENSVTLEVLEEAKLENRLKSLVMDSNVVLTKMPFFEINKEEVDKLLHGGFVAVDSNILKLSSTTIRAVYNKRLAAIAQLANIENNYYLKPVKVLMDISEI